MSHQRVSSTGAQQKAPSPAHSESDLLLSLVAVTQSLHNGCPCQRCAGAGCNRQQQRPQESVTPGVALCLTQASSIVLEDDVKQGTGRRSSASLIRLLSERRHSAPRTNDVDTLTLHAMQDACATCRVRSSGWWVKGSVNRWRLWKRDMSTCSGIPVQHLKGCRVELSSEAGHRGCPEGELPAGG